MEDKREREEKKIPSSLSFKTDVYKKIFLTGLALLFVAYLFVNSKTIFSGLGVLLGVIAPFIPVSYTHLTLPTILLV